MKKTVIKKITACAVLSALSILAFMLESLFPPLFVPGARMGLSNIFILLSAIVLGYGYGYTVLILKIVLGSVFSGNISAMLYSLPAGLISLSVELLLFSFCKRISVICISVTGAVINVTLQNVVFCLVTDSVEYLSFLPYLSLIGVLAGITVGFSVYLLIKKLPNGILDIK